MVIILLRDNRVPAFELCFPDAISLSDIMGQAWLECWRVIPLTLRSHRPILEVSTACNPSLHCLVMRLVRL